LVPIGRVMMEDSELDALEKEVEAEKKLPARVRKLLKVQAKLKKPVAKGLLNTSYFCPRCGKPLVKRAVVVESDNKSITGQLFTNYCSYFTCPDQDKCKYEYAR
jgi:hypothetical protein